MGENSADNRILTLTAQIVAAHAAHNALEPGALPAVIRQIYQMLLTIEAEPAAPAEKAQPAMPQPAVPVRKSVFPDYIICLEDGKQLKMLKRHLSSAFNLTPRQYREKWGLDASYPMVAPNYAAKRSSLAKQIGLGTRRAAGD